ncbi:copper amine oxidase N-terminal domain-containing protein [Brevibacillus borstelensis]|uniref:copper amine oxidase N-terminal domain-containing protein n=1 Tax=Brevibacillus borstelensis TaxID=45462 RepID=UPI0030BD6E59
MFQAKWKCMTILSLLVVLLSGNKTYAARDFFWSDVVPIPSCSKSRDGSLKELMIKKEDGTTITEELPSCEEAMKTRVLVRVNGKYLHAVAGTGGEPYIDNGRTMVPLRAIADVFGFEVGWEESEGKITLKKEGKNIVMHIGKSEMLVDGEKVIFEDAVPTRKKNLTFLPVKQLADVLGIKVEWDGEKRLATFTSE